MTPYRHWLFEKAIASLSDAWLNLTDVDGNITQDEEGRIVTANDPWIMDACNSIREIISELEEVTND